MKRVYNLLGPKLGQRLRNVLEFDGGVCDTQLMRASPEANTWVGSAVYRKAVGSRPPARIPSGPAHRTYDIGYFPRDVRRTKSPGDVAIDESFDASVQGYLEKPELVANPTRGSPGAKNPDVERYDPAGLRTAMTANWPATERALTRVRETHAPTPSWAKDSEATKAWLAARKASGAPIEGMLGVPVPRRITPWTHTRSTLW